jgi:membrane protease YdiL (CAAX protease family)
VSKKGYPPMADPDQETIGTPEDVCDKVRPELELHQEAFDTPPDRPPWKMATVEVSVFLFLIVPTMVLSLFISSGRAGSGNFVLVATATILRDLALLSLIFYFAWRDREPLGRLGWRYETMDGDIVWGFVLYVPLLLVVGLVEQALRSAGLSQPSQSAGAQFHFTGSGQLALAVLLVIVVAICEETIFRGYIFLRLRTVTTSTTAAVLLASAFFAIGHGYEGSLGMATVGFMGLLFNLIYLWRKSLIAPMILHFLQDFIAIVIVPFLK